MGKIFFTSNLGHFSVFVFQFFQPCQGEFGWFEQENWPKLTILNIFPEFDQKLRILNHLGHFWIHPCHQGKFLTHFFLCFFAIVWTFFLKGKKTRKNDAPSRKQEKQCQPLTWPFLCCSGKKSKISKCTKMVDNHRKSLWTWNTILGTKQKAHQFSGCQQGFGLVFWLFFDRSLCGGIEGGGWYLEEPPL